MLYNIPVSIVIKHIVNSDSTILSLSHAVFLFPSLLGWHILLKTDVTTFRSVVYSSCLGLVSYVCQKLS